MNEYTLLLKKDLWILKNHGVEVKKNPKRLIIYLLYILWIGSIIFNAVFNSRHGVFDNMKTSLGPQILEAAYTILITVFLLYYLLKGTEESSTFFSMGDVHLLFPAPKSSRNILLYQMIKHSLFKLFLMGFFIVALLPTILNMTRVDFHYIGFMYLGYLGLVLLIGPLNFLIFALGAKYNIQHILKKSIQGLIALAILYVVFFILYKGDPVEGLFAALNGKIINYIPIIGWSKSAFMVPIKGYNSYGLISLVFLYLATILSIVICYRTADDYYEDVLSSTEKHALRIKIKRGTEKTPSKIFILNKNKKVHIGSSGTGPWSLLWRAKVEYSRTDIHPFVSILTVVFLIVGIGAGYFGKKYMGSSNLIYFVNGMIAYMIFIFTSIQARNNELMKPFIFLMPGSAIKKIIGANLIEVIRMGISAMVLNISLGWMIGAPWYRMTIMSLFLISFFILNLSSSFIIRAIFPEAVDQKALFPLFIMLQILLLLIPGLVFGGIAAFIFKSPSAFFLGVTTANSVIIGSLLLLGNAIFERMEWR